MKNILLFCLLACCCLAAKAQGNLQFNQVILYDLTFGSTQAINVPAGKVWKIESAGASTTSCNVHLQNSASQIISIIWNGSSCASCAPLPIWLPSGYTGAFAYNLNNCIGAHAMVSIIEFNVVP
jgi:hypothetical protein